jgi:hypothetical protein
MTRARRKNLMNDGERNESSGMPNGMPGIRNK